MSTRKTPGLDRARPESRRTLEPTPFAARAGLYSEVVWDRSWAMPAPEKRSRITRAQHQAPPPE
ncbi:hypothetical protein N0B44_31210 [Roseibacterium beibuensis]|uniref:hypothetical protein n=1 Tax=[Roseibacterium] beibuensis TaxID=1193142 RepID=UPI00217F1621|nr:hypothetical protein [Roseibacterium beibuensis]MCS6627386.1 hypothetical protein [Roseibacterium beibuensis]